MVSGDALKARRHAREIVAEMRWHGMAVPPLYARMAVEFQGLVRSGDYAAWVAASQTPAVMGRKPHGAGLPGLVRRDRSTAARATPLGSADGRSPCSSARPPPAGSGFRAMTSPGWGTPARRPCRAGPGGS
jgi:hypothetical protein